MFTLFMAQTPSPFAQIVIHRTPGRVLCLEASCQTPAGGFRHPLEAGGAFNRGQRGKGNPGLTWGIILDNRI